MPHILIVEDDTDINNATAQYLRRHGCQCTQAFSGTEGRLLWKGSGCDLLLIDLLLPGLSGSELIDEIRRESQVPIIVLSARSALSDKVELLGLGADDYLTKPYQLGQDTGTAAPRQRGSGGGDPGLPGLAAACR